MSNIERQPNGRWRARYRDLNGRSRSQTFDRKQDAQNFLAVTATDQHRGEWVDPRKRREIFDDWATRWWKSTASLRPSTRRGYWRRLQDYVLPHFGGRKIADIDWTDVEDFSAELLGRGLSPKTVREALIVVSGVMNYAVKAKVRRDNPAAGHKLPQRRRKIRQGDVLDMAEVERLVEATRDPYKAAVWLIAMAGLRPSELCGLRVRSVNFGRRMLHVNETLQPVQKFDDQPYRVVEGDTKTVAGDRDIPLPKWICDDLAAMLAARAAKRRTEAVAQDEHLFLTRHGNPVNRDRFREYTIRPALRRAGLPDTFRTYGLRHSHASMLIDEGASPLAVAQRMGHTDVATTLRHYGHLFEGVQERLTEQLDERRGRAAKAAAGATITPLPLPETGTGS